VLPLRTSQLQVIAFLDQRVAELSRCLDYEPFRYFRTFFSSVFPPTAHLKMKKGTAQLIVAGVGIFHLEWAAKPWQTCEL